MGYSFNDLYGRAIYEGSDEIYNQEWVKLSQGNTYREFSETGISSSCTVENFINDVIHINTLIAKQGLFYKNTKGEPQPNGPANEKIITDVMSLCREILDKKTQYTAEVLEDQILRYNNNLENSLAAKYKKAILDECERYNQLNPAGYQYTGELLVNSTTGDCGYAQEWVDNTIKITNADRNLENLTLAEVENCDLLRKLIEKNPNVNVNIRKRDMDTGR